MLDECAALNMKHLSDRRTIEHEQGEVGKGLDPREI
jgi:hypothetical protein